MITAKYFTYQGICTSYYGLEIAEFENNDNVTETIAYATNPTVLSIPSLKRVLLGSNKLAAPDPITFSLVGEKELSALERSRIIGWLTSSKDFQPIKFLEDDLLYYTYFGVFTNITTLFVNGHCRGFKLTMQPDSLYARGIPTQATTTSGTHTITIINNSSIFNGYTYPTVSFAGSSISIINTTDDPSRAFAFTDLPNNEFMVVDCEMKIMRSSTTASGSRLSKFNKNWLRLRPGENILTVESQGDVTIVCPTYILTGV